MLPGLPNEANSYGKVIIFELTDLKTRSRGSRVPRQADRRVLVRRSVAAARREQATGLDDLGGVGLDAKRSVEHYGRNVSLARFGTALASPGDLNHDGYEGG
ncbi:hypothetical protein GWK47_053706 [Chionoecetes opilio]|uniref:Uncharacterized protein n=1 Tax=Chionoecetes opilio TaxID=41210 RepID=A0A8J4Y0D7_CHIOP|nr:hypothetical protein GWK47_053706 [Chionoecetes opilio]